MVVAISTTFYTINRVQIKKGTNATPFEIWYGNSPNCKFYILKESRNGKFDARSDEGIFLGYSTRRKAYKCLNANTKKVMESANVNFDEHAEVQNNESSKKSKE